jgi:xanthine dehydrogenase accessory factor
MPFHSRSTHLLIAQAHQCLNQRIAAVVVDIYESQGSLPRQKGTWMLVTAQAVVGTIGGGHLEFEAIARARRMLSVGLGTEQHERYLLGPSLGQCCGGAVDLRFRQITEAVLNSFEDGAFEDDQCRFNLHLFGAGHVGEALIHALLRLPCKVRWIDERESFFAAAPKSENLEVVCVDSPAAEVAVAKSGDYFLVLTHSHALDLEIVEAVIRRADAGYLGLIGSKTKRASFIHKLERIGLSSAQLHCPVGLEGIQGKHPEVIAASVVADLLLRSSL